jgi:hypothetical protein
MYIQSILSLGFLANAATAALTACGTNGSSQALKSLSKELRNEPLAGRGQRKTVEIKTFVHIVAASEKEEDGYLTVGAGLFGHLCRDADVFYRKRPSGASSTS